MSGVAECSGRGCDFQRAGRCLVGTPLVGASGAAGCLERSYDPQWAEVSLWCLVVICLVGVGGTVERSEVHSDLRQIGMDHRLLAASSSVDGLRPVAQCSQLEAY